MGRMFEKRKHRMFARFDKMAKAFTRIGKEISIAVKLGGPDPDGNPRLRAAIRNAKINNMPKDRVEAAIKKASGKDAADLNEITYEGYGPHGIAILVETATDNPNRTVANVRSHFGKGGGQLGNAGSVAFMFDRKGVFKKEVGDADPEELEMQFIEFGADDIEIEDGVLTAYTSFEGYAQMQAALEENNIEVTHAELEQIPQTTVELNDEQMEDLDKLLARLEEDDDVQSVFHNIG
ncbi:MAG: YebC/PmpR family DNA-binding transcriptional regulator [Candidatus Kapaibacteriales bacterium]